MTVTTERAPDTCAECGVEDTHAKHIVYAAMKHPITERVVDLSLSKHIQCCAENGCSICQTDLEFAEQAGVKNHTSPSHAFNEYMQNKTEDHHLALADRHGISSHLFEGAAPTDG